MIQSFYYILRNLKITVLGFMIIATVLPVPVHAQQTAWIFIGQQSAFDVASVRPSTLRRLRFYSEKARAALAEMAKADNLTGATGEELAATATANLRKWVEKLIDAGAKAKLDLEQTAAFFAQDLRENYTGQLPFIVFNEAGELNTSQLFQGVYDARASITASADADYLAYVNNLGNEAISGNIPKPEQPTQRAAASPKEEPQRDPAIQAYWDRLIERDGMRYIRVAPGDTLATYASAFYGDSLQYRKIYSANTDVMETPNLLTVGDTIEIPR
ncbi:LysM peptidoglycan-binding domain-containing protein [Profundibacter sp.]|uniref:LysM peptidoglycan-binding domain-containing protein n=1 Tax=Profundibacter sp. TaxID=3101071 RepID=UPI003D09599F